MLLSDISVKRPVLAVVMSLILIAFGLVSFDRLSLREYPNIDPPIVSIDTSYRGASANVVETRITEVIEDRIAGVEGIQYIQSTSEDGRSRITIEFDIERDIESAANDIRDRVSRILDNIPEEADPPEVQKVDSSDDVVVWLSLISENMSSLELTDYADRYLVDRFSILNGVASVRLGGGLEKSMRVWLDRKEMAARNITVLDIENAIRQENVELPAGSIESKAKQFTVRVERNYLDSKDFENLVIVRGSDYLVRLKDVAKVEVGAIEKRTLYRGNGQPMVGLGIIKQSLANTIDVAREVETLREDINGTLPEGIRLEMSYDTSVFISNAIHEVYVTLFIAIALVVLVIYFFLRDFRATLIPSVTVPISIMATFIVLFALGYSVNILTLLALVLAIGLVVDDAIIVLENVYKRIEQGDQPLAAAYLGTRQVGFAVVATTLILTAVFVPITFLEGDIGRLFSEFAVTLAAAVLFSGFVALTLCPMLCSKLLKKAAKKHAQNKELNEQKETKPSFMDKIDRKYESFLSFLLGKNLLVVIIFGVLLASTYGVYKMVPAEFAPKEDRGAFFVRINGPEGASYEYMLDYVNEIEKRLMYLVENGEARRILVRAPGSFGSQAFNSAMVIVVLNDWGDRRNGFDIIDEVRGKISDLPGVRAFPIMRQSFGGGTSKPVQFVLGGASSYEELAQWRDIILEKLNQDNPGLGSIDWDYKETKPQFKVYIDKNRAGDLGVSVREIGQTLEALQGSKQVTTFIENGKEYDVLIEAERADISNIDDMLNIYVRSFRTGELIPLSNLVQVEEYADSSTLNRYNRIRSLTIDANLEGDLTLGQALDHLEKIARENLPETLTIDYKGQSLDLKTSSSSLYFIFLLGLVVVYLVLAAQFESFLHPFVIILTVPLAIFGALLGLWIFGQSLNIYTQIGMIMLIGLASKNGILIVEFINQLRDGGKEFKEAIVEGTARRLRPILMTSFTAVMGAIPLIITSGAGSETRVALGVVIFSGVLVSTFFTIVMIPSFYYLICRKTKPKTHVEKKLIQQLELNNE